MGKLVKQQDLEGIVLKKSDSKYQIDSVHMTGERFQL